MFSISLLFYLVMSAVSLIIRTHRHWAIVIFASFFSLQDWQMQQHHKIKAWADFKLYSAPADVHCFPRFAAHCQVKCCWCSFVSSVSANRQPWRQSFLACCLFTIADCFLDTVAGSAITSSADVTLFLFFPIAIGLFLLHQSLTEKELSFTHSPLKRDLFAFYQSADVCVLCSSTLAMIFCHLCVLSCGKLAWKSSPNRQLIETVLLSPNWPR